MRPPRLLLPLVLLALLGCALIVYTGLRMAREDDERLAGEVRTLASQRIHSTARGLATLFGDRVPQLLAFTDDLPTDPDELRARLRKGVWYRQALVADARGRLVFPPPLADGARSAAEVEFLERSRPVWARGLSATPPPDDSASGAVLNTPGVIGAPPEPLTPQASTEPTRTWQWRTWYWGPGIHVGFVRTLGDGRVVMVEVERARMLADVMERLPSDGTDEPPTELLDEAGRTLYSWGTQDALPDKQTLETALPAPLSNWHLRQTVALPGAATPQRLGLWAGMVAALAALLGGLGHVHRESTLATREAMQRVTFVNQVSHELKTPLTNIRMYAEMLEDELELEPDAPAARHLKVVISESQRLSRLIANILTFARSQRSTLTLHPTPTVPDTLVQSVLEGFGPALEARGIAVELALDTPRAHLLDPDAVGQVLGNLIGNVEKYAGPGGRLRLESSATEDQVTLRVVDDGPGIPAAARERIFQPFQRLDDRLTEGVSGTGIGLTIARELARLHGGDVRLLDAQSGRGATFEITLRGAPV